LCVEYVGGTVFLVPASEQVMSNGVCSDVIYSRVRVHTVLAAAAAGGLLAMTSLTHVDSLL